MWLAGLQLEVNHAMKEVRSPIISDPVTILRRFLIFHRGAISDSESFLSPTLTNIVNVFPKADMKDYISNATECTLSSHYRNISSFK